MSFFDELKKRKVYRTAATYAVVAFVIMQIIEIVFPMFGIPDWAGRMIIILLFLGFPITIVFSWMYDVGEKSMVRAKPMMVGGEEDTRNLFARKRIWFLSAGVVAAVLVGYRSSGTVFGYKIGGPSGDDKSIAVLPFDNFSKDKDDEYLSDGITEDITMNLAKIKELTVISRTSVMGYKHSNKKIKEIAKELGVKYILEGSVRKIGERVRIVSQLIDAPNDKHIWSDSYDREMEDLFDIQADVSKEIANAMEAELTDNALAQIETAPTDNMKAYELYKKARNYQYRSFRESDFNLAVDYYRQAIELEPNFADSYAGISEVHDFIIWMGYDISDERKKLVKENLAKAKELAPQNLNVRLANAIYLYRQRKYFPAMDEYRAIRVLQPGNSEIWERIAFIQYRVNQFEESLNNLLDAYKVNPKSPRLLVQVGLGYQLMFDYDNAIKYYDIAINLAPDISGSAYRYKSESILLRDGDYDLSSKILDQGILRTSDNNSLGLKTNLLIYKGKFKDALENISKIDGEFVSFINNSRTPNELPMAICFDGLNENVRAKKYFNIAKEKMEQQVQDSPDDYRTHAGLGIVYSHLGMKVEAVREGRTALAILPPSKDSFFGVYQVLTLAYIYKTLGDDESALDQLQTILNKNGGITVQYIQNIPQWSQLKNHPRVIQWKKNKQNSS